MKQGRVTMVLLLAAAAEAFSPGALLTHLRPNMVALQMNTEQDSSATSSLPSFVADGLAGMALRDQTTLPPAEQDVIVGAVRRSLSIDGIVPTTPTSEGLLRLALHRPLSVPSPSLCFPSPTTFLLTSPSPRSWAAARSGICRFVR